MENKTPRKYIDKCFVLEEERDSKKPYLNNVR